jgi:hypothetical protein
MGVNYHNQTSQIKPIKLNISEVQNLLKTLSLCQNPVFHSDGMMEHWNNGIVGTKG